MAAPPRTLVVGLRMAASLALLNLHAALVVAPPRNSSSSSIRSTSSSSSSVDPSVRTPVAAAAPVVAARPRWKRSEQPPDNLSPYAALDPVTGFRLASRGVSWSVRGGGSSGSAVRNTVGLLGPYAPDNETTAAETLATSNTTTTTTSTNDDDEAAPPAPEEEKPVAAEPEAPTLPEPPEPSPEHERWFRRSIGGLFSAAGFLGSSVRSLLRVGGRSQAFLDDYRATLKALEDFLHTSGVQTELEDALLHNPQAALDLALLARVHKQQQQQQQQASTTNQATTKPKRAFTRSVHGRPTKGLRVGPAAAKTKKNAGKSRDAAAWEEVRRYMRYATAVYGKNMIRSAQMDATGSIDPELLPGSSSTKAIAHHIGIPEEDLVVVDVHDEEPTSAAEGEEEHLRHLVAVDHAQRAVVLSIRGTYSLREVLVDAAAHTRRGFCGGEAHAGMAESAEKVWGAAGPKVREQLLEHPGYSFVVTGHSLGAGAASLLTVLLTAHPVHRLRPGESIVGLPRYTKIKCFAYAAPPVFYPPAAAGAAARVTTSLRHSEDVVPYLSVFSVRHLLGSLRAVASEASDLGWHEKLAMALGRKPLPEGLVAAVDREGPPPPIEGAPPLGVPAHTTWHLTETENGIYEASKHRPRAGPGFAIRIHPDLLVDHFPGRYEYALRHSKLPSK